MIFFSQNRLAATCNPGIVSIRRFSDSVRTGSKVCVSKLSPASMLRVFFFFWRRDGPRIETIPSFHVADSFFFWRRGLRIETPLLFLGNFHEVSVLSDRTDVGNRMLKPALPIYVK